MRVIHGVWAHGALCLWAEDPDLPPVSGVTPSPDVAGEISVAQYLPSAWYIFIGIALRYV